MLYVSRTSDLYLELTSVTSDSIYFELEAVHGLKGENGTCLIDPSDQIGLFRSFRIQSAFAALLT
jgi:hypothetical protein